MAIARPMPRLPPVTSAFWSAMRDRFPNAAIVTTAQKLFQV
jgi:hypothetical protein